MEAAPEGPGFECPWQWTSDLNLCGAIPRAGRRLLEKALVQWPLRLESDGPRPAGRPELSIIIGHRGAARVPLLLRTLASVAGQTLRDFECIVVEQDSASLLEGNLPGWVEHVLSVPPAGLPYSRSWAFNVGARRARGRVLVFHDNDMLMPAAYGAEVLRLARRGYEAMRLMRFLFYLGQGPTAELLDGGGRCRLVPERVSQNCAGGTIAVTREAYFRLGGHDEAFVGWGGEDNEFLERCRLLSFYPWGYLPFVHLWHEPQAEKALPARAKAYLDAIRSASPAERATKLAAAEFGSELGPSRGFAG